nr:nuclear receptor subfamily 0 group B member [Hymenolepis microstoma]
MNLLEHCIFLITDIPSGLKTADLRRVFSQHIEAGVFSCFHYRHRPLSSRIALLSCNKLDVKTLLCILKQHRTTKAQSCTALISIKPENVERLLSSFEDTWCTDDQCGIYPICKFFPVSYGSSDIHSLKKLCEFNPPSWMPQGNVGTSSSHFFSLIRSCRLSSALIKNLKLNFPRSRVNRKYGNVPYEYSDHNTYDITGSQFYDNQSDIGAKSCEIITKSGLILSHPVQGDELAEEWDRFESLHDDPYNMDRTANHSLKYENKIELKWEKGGSGLVYYTDEQFWRERESVRKDEFFNEPASFDWDVNMQHYSDDEGLAYVGPGGPDLDRKQINDILCNSADDPNTSKPYLSPYGERIMRKQGWRKGLRLGHPKRRGLLDPLTSEDSITSRNRSGFGFVVPSIRSRLKRTPNLPGNSSYSQANRLIINTPSNSVHVGVKFKSGGIINNPKT